MNSADWGQVSTFHILSICVSRFLNPASFSNLNSGSHERVSAFDFKEVSNCRMSIPLQNPLFLTASGKGQWWRKKRRSRIDSDRLSRGGEGDWNPHLLLGFFV